MPYDIGAAAGNVASNAANGAIGAIMGLALEKHNDARQIRQQQKLTDMQANANRQQADYSQKLAYDMWEKTNYSAQMQQLKKAGLNPGLIYGMSGGGATTTGAPNTAGVGAGQAPQGGGEVQGMGIQMMQLQLMQAQKENIEADTANKNADTTNKPKTGANIEASTGQILANTGNIKADTKLKEIQTMIQEATAKYADEAAETQLFILKDTDARMTNEINKLSAEADLATQTVETKIEQARAELTGQYLQNAAVKAGIQLTEEQTKQVIQNIQTQIKQLQLQGRSLDQKDKDILIDQERNRLINKGIEWGAASQVIGNVVNVLTKKPPIINQTENKTITNHNKVFETHKY